ncbi:MAG: hypothetical protein KAH06_03530 [Desulfobacterales bacterium]|nr:hypothetical protein [Desulfobacterales bacterium]
MEKILNGTKIIDPHIIPILYKPVQIFKKPPNTGAYGKKYKKIAGSTFKQTGTAAKTGKTIDEQNIAQPKGQKGIGLPINV